MSNLSPAAIIYDSSGVEKGTAPNPVRVDPTGTTAQPVTDNGGSITVDGTITTNQGTAAAVSGGWPVQITDGISSVAVELVGSRAAIAVAYPEMMKVLERISAQLETVTQQLAAITDEEDPL